MTSQLQHEVAVYGGTAAGMLGQVTGMAAAQVAASGQAVQRIDIPSLHRRLVDAGQVLAL